MAKKQDLNIPFFDGPPQPLPEPLRGDEPGTFAHRTVTARLPNIARAVLQENDFPPPAVARLEGFLEEIPQDHIRLFEDPGAPDEEDWRAYTLPHLESNWLQAPWFFVETYFYRRIMQAIGYFQPGPLQGVDPFALQKRQALELGLESIRRVARQLPAAPAEVGLQDEAARGALARLILLSVWGNQADLSMWSTQDAGRPEHREDEQQRSHLLVDDTGAVLDYLSGLGGRPARLDFIPDNTGPELFHDLALADLLLSGGVAGSVCFHLKIHPTYVSDAMVKDVHASVAAMAAEQEGGVKALGERLSAHLASGRLQLQQDFYWTSPLPLWEMPERLRRELGGSDLIVSKGDANYRRLLGDRRWPHTTSFGEILRYAPAPLLALRVCKAELAAGLKPGQAEALANEDPDWLVDGNWGVIQLAR